MKKKAIVIAGTKGIGKSISNELINLNFKVTSTGSATLDTSNIKSVKKFISKNKSTDVLILNTGGPPSLKLENVTEEDWIKYFNQLFLSFVMIINNIKVNKNGYVFLLSSYLIKNPKDNMVISNSMRIAFSSIFKTYGSSNLKNNITTLNLALGPIYTQRLKDLNPGKTKEDLGKKHPLGRVGNPNEVSDIISAVIEKKIKYLNCQTLVLDGGLSNNLL